MKRYVWLILFALLIGAPLSAQQGGSVYILVVDDFGDQISSLSAAIRGNASANGILHSEVQRIQRGGGISNNPANRGGNRANPPPTAPPTALQNQLDQQARTAVANAVEGNVATENCGVVTEGQGFFATGGTSFFATGGTGFFATGGTGASGAIPHGRRIVAELQDLQQQYHSAPIQIVQVDTQGFTTSVIADNLTRKINQIVASDPNAKFVVNMSFAVIPCGALATLAIYDALMHQVDADLSGNLDAMREVFNELLATGVLDSPLNSNDDLQNLVQEKCNASGTTCRTGTNPIIMVAAAGNSSEPFPFFPAAWRGIVSVSASDDAAGFVTGKPLASYSNDGAVMMPGRWQHELGTSFAAPRYSFAMALMLAGTGPRDCRANISPALPDDWLTSPPAAHDQRLC
jgi:Subtilase family